MLEKICYHYILNQSGSVNFSVAMFEVRYTIEIQLWQTLDGKSSKGWTEKKRITLLYEQYIW